jgi:hypothetical protein
MQRVGALEYGFGADEPTPLATPCTGHKVPYGIPNACINCVHVDLHVNTIHLGYKWT